YSRAEAAVLKRVTAHVLCRDTLLAESLLRHGVNARSAGNVMIDTIAYGEYAVAARRRAPLAVLLLPGSRDSAGAQLALQLAAVRLVLTQGAIDVFVALAGGIAPESLAAATGTVYHPPASA